MGAVSVHLNIVDGATSIDSATALIRNPLFLINSFSRVISLLRWQVSNAIKSANVAMRLVFLGFSELPRNASQALALADLSLERLGEVWGNITKNFVHHKITTDVIKREISPDVQSLASTIRIPTVLLERLREQAQDVGLSLNGYLEQLADGQSPDGSRDVETEPLTAASSKGMEMNC